MIRSHQFCTVVQVVSVACLGASPAPAKITVPQSGQLRQARSEERLPDLAAVRAVSGLSGL